MGGNHVDPIENDHIYNYMKIFSIFKTQKWNTKFFSIVSHISCGLQIKKSSIIISDINKLNLNSKSFFPKFEY